jgi:hypothetical protein
MPLKPTLEARARIATLICHGVGGFFVTCGLLAIAGGILMHNDRLGPIIGGVISTLIGGAFFVAKPITAEHLSSGMDGL